MENTMQSVVDSTAVEISMAAQRRLDPIENLLGRTLSDLRMELGRASIEAARTLHDRDESNHYAMVRLGAAARDVCRIMFGDADPPLEFWATDLGHDVAWAIGYPRATVSAIAAAAVLKRQRSSIYFMVNQGTLVLTPAGLRRELRFQAGGLVRRQ